MINYSAVNPPETSVKLYEAFEGIDAAKAPSNVDDSRSPDCLNMIRDEIGKVRKRTGYFEKFSLTGTVYGIFKYYDDYIVHAGTNLYRQRYIGSAWTSVLLYSDMNEHRSMARQYDGKLWMVDGKTYLCYDGTTCAPVEGYVPLVITAMNYDATGGTYLDDINLLSDYAQYGYSEIPTIESHYYKYTLPTNGYQLSKVEIFDADTGEFVEITESEVVAPYEGYYASGGYLFIGEGNAPDLNGENNCVMLTFNRTLTEALYTGTTQADGFVYAELTSPYDGYDVVGALARNDVTDLYEQLDEVETIPEDPMYVYVATGSLSAGSFYVLLPSMAYHFTTTAALSANDSILLDITAMKAYQTVSGVTTELIVGEGLGMTQLTFTTCARQSAWKKIKRYDGTSGLTGIMNDKIHRFNVDGVDFIFTASASLGTDQPIWFEFIDSPLYVGKIHYNNGASVDYCATYAPPQTVDIELGALTEKNYVAMGLNGKATGYKVQYRTGKNHRGILDNCDVITMYGVHGQSNRIFLTGNPDFPNRDYWSELQDPTYFSDLSYSVLGADDSAIVGYSKRNGRLLAHKDTVSGEIYSRYGEYEEDSSGVLVEVFRVDSVMNGTGAVSKYAFQDIIEPLFLTERGVQTIAVQDLTNAEYEQIRSDRIAPLLKAEETLANAVSAAYKDYYLLANGTGRVYVLDTIQRYYESNRANSQFQYAAFVWDDVPAICFCVDDEKLMFGAADGKVYEFYTNTEDENSYTDAGEAINAYWTFSEFTGRSAVFWNNKNIKRIFLRLKSYVHTGAKIEAKIDGMWYTMMNDFASYGYFDFSNIDFANFTFSTDHDPKHSGVKTHQNKLDKVTFRIVNDKDKEPFGVVSFGFTYTEKGVNRR